MPFSRRLCSASAIAQFSTRSVQSNQCLCAWASPLRLLCGDFLPVQWCLIMRSPNKSVAAAAAPTHVMSGACPWPTAGRQCVSERMAPQPMSCMCNGSLSCQAACKFHNCALKLVPNSRLWRCGACPGTPSRTHGLNQDQWKPIHGSKGWLLVVLTLKIQKASASCVSTVRGDLGRSFRLCRCCESSCW